MRLRAFKAAAKPAAFAIVCLLSIAALAHVDWTQTNSSDPDQIALYQFSEHHAALFENAAGLSSDMDLVVGAPVGDDFHYEHSELVEPFFGPHAIEFNSEQSCQSTGEADADGDVTIEFWFRWDSTTPVSNIQVGLASGAKLTLVRDAATPANDRFGMTFVHGDFVSAPDFASWAAVGIDEAPFDEWLHVAVCIHSTGLTFDDGLAHDVYLPGSVARFFLNGHLVGAPAREVDIAGTRAHGHSATRVRNFGGPILVDEVAIWSIDWSENGAETFPFGDGRGVGLPSAASDWNAFE